MKIKDSISTMAAAALVLCMLSLSFLVLRIAFAARNRDLALRKRDLPSASMIGRHWQPPAIDSAHRALRPPSRSLATFNARTAATLPLT
ncbi:MAG TPA: hypothetical protein VGM82_21170 [Gemmatimonadaceae bacterium]|jgi:hypothetical protein